MSKKDFEHLSECIDGFGFNESVKNGHFTDFNYSDKMLRKLAKDAKNANMTELQAIENIVTTIYIELHTKFA